MKYHNDSWRPTTDADASALKGAFQRDGILHVQQLLSSKEVSHIRTTFEEQRKRDLSWGHDDHVPSTDILAQYPRFIHPHRRRGNPAGEIAFQYLMDERILSVLRDALGGEEVYGGQSMYYFKPPGARGQSLHQDNKSLHVYPDTCIAVWIAMDDADEDNGGLVVVPGSHTSEIICKLVPADSEKSWSAETISLPPCYAPLQTRIKAGDALVFHGHLIHGSPPNITTDRFRQALIFHYIPQASQKVNAFYQPLIRPDGTEVGIDNAEEGGPCGQGFSPDDV